MRVRDLRGMQRGEELERELHSEGMGRLRVGIYNGFDASAYVSTEAQHGQVHGQVHGESCIAVALSEPWSDVLGSLDISINHLFSSISPPFYLQVHQNRLKVPEWINTDAEKFMPNASLSVLYANAVLLPCSKNEKPVKEIQSPFFLKALASGHLSCAATR